MLSFGSQPPCCKKPKPHGKATSQHSSWPQLQLSQLTTGIHHQLARQSSWMSSPVGSLDSSSHSHHLTATTWQTSRENFPGEPSKPTGPREIIRCCLKSQRFGVACYTTISNWNTALNSFTSFYDPELLSQVIYDHLCKTLPLPSSLQIAGLILNTSKLNFEVWIFFSYWIWKGLHWIWNNEVEF